MSISNDGPQHVTNVSNAANVNRDMEAAPADGPDEAQAALNNRVSKLSANVSKVVSDLHEAHKYDPNYKKITASKGKAKASSKNLNNFIGKLIEPYDDKIQKAKTSIKVLDKALTERLSMPKADEPSDSTEANKKVTDKIAARRSELNQLEKKREQLAALKGKGQAGEELVRMIEDEVSAAEQDLVAGCIECGVLPTRPEPDATSEAKASYQRVIQRICEEAYKQDEGTEAIRKALIDDIKENVLEPMRGLIGKRIVGEGANPADHQQIIDEKMNELAEQMVLVRFAVAPHLAMIRDTHAVMDSKSGMVTHSAEELVAMNPALGGAASLVEKVAQGFFGAATAVVTEDGDLAIDVGVRVGEGGDKVVNLVSSPETGAQYALGKANTSDVGDEVEIMMRFRGDKSIAQAFGVTYLAAEGGEQAYILMPLYAGDVSDFIPDGGLNDDKKTAQLLLGAARGVKHMHKKGIAHEDLKLAQMFKKKDSEGGGSVIGDFGHSQDISKETGKGIVITPVNDENGKPHPDYAVLSSGSATLNPPEVEARRHIIKPNTDELPAVKCLKDNIVEDENGVQVVERDVVMARDSWSFGCALLHAKYGLDLPPWAEHGNMDSGELDEDSMQLYNTLSTNEAKEFYFAEAMNPTHLNSDLMLHCEQADIDGMLEPILDPNSPLDNLIAECFNLDPRQRPSFKKIHKTLEKL